MRELDALIKSYKEAVEKDTGCVLATVVHVEGSSYRRAGARMLVDESGMMTGAISGGCLEGDALRKALHALHKKENKLVTYDTSDENDAVIGAQLGCNGIIQVLFEPLDPEDPANPIGLLEKVLCSNEPAAIITLFNLDRSVVQIGTGMLVDGQENLTGTVKNESLLKQLKLDAAEALGQKESMFREYVSGMSSVNAFIEVRKPPVRLVLVGAGNDASILADMAAKLGWNITVTDGRRSHARADRFVSSCQVIVSKPEKILEDVEINDRTAFVLMTHNYNYDMDVLKILAEETDVPYIGILGPQKKYQRMLDDLKDEGIILTEDQQSRIYAPVGLDIGADTPAEIALSVLAEIQQVLSGAAGNSLREISGPIHKNKKEKFKKVILD
ncbi:XdhC family protein [Balneola sp. MJW-20]|uniref:XdhC family protein n=1 Tax=Gracilimonas aurantiaca TaxID=3234185 RepID=UPI0034655B83